MNNWSVGLDSWILADGNYADFEVGETRQFALEFHSQDLANSDSLNKSVELIDGCNYRVNAIVAYMDEEMWVLDFGIRAYDQRVPADREIPEARRRHEDFVSALSVGQAVTCTLHLSIDHYMYMEFFCSKPNMIPIIYTWQIDGIAKQTGPRILVQNSYVVDEENAQWHNVESTQSAVPEPTGANELLCTLVNTIPTADGEPLARWDEPEELRAIRTMQPAELNLTIERCDAAITKLEKFLAASLPYQPEGKTDIEFIVQPITSDGVRIFEEQYEQYLQSIDQTKVDRLIHELDLKQILEQLSLPLEWIVRDPRLSGQFIAHVSSLKAQALERLATLQAN